MKSGCRYFGPDRFWLELAAALALVLAQSGFAASPIETVLSGEFASFTNRNHPGNRIGYRFHEHTPLIWGAVPVTDTDVKPAQTAPAIKRFSRRPGVKTFHRLDSPGVDLLSCAGVGRH